MYSDENKIYYIRHCNECRLTFDVDFWIDKCKFICPFCEERVSKAEKSLKKMKEKLGGPEE
ncbi:MAG: hypothetical protein HY818_05330 [Acetobacterium woodii]|nr:hypothetical protein [Acetobacterium woodii]